MQDSWLHLPVFFPIRLDAWVVMPNHFHAVVWIEDRDDEILMYGRSIRPVGLQENDSWRADASPQPIGTQPGSLGAIIQNFKSITTRKINQQFGVRGAPIWQRNYFEHIIRNEEELQRIAAYIQVNPTNWASDQENKP